VEVATRVELDAPRMECLLAWCRRGEVAHGAALPADARDLWGAAPTDAAEDYLAGPLGPSDAPAGLLVVVGRPAAAFTTEHVEIVRELLDPFSVALENDRRLHEIAALREAAEADKASLLTKLGREEMHDAIVGADSGLRLVMQRVELVAKSDAPILILGDTGTGKEVVARAIHERSPRADGPFLRVNCGAIPRELVDSQLFGHERGAFTGASQQRKGWFERADRGTLFLDEVAELPLDAQVRLLRVLQDGWLERVGGHEPIHVDVRIVAATHRDLPALVAARAFREDLWYRIAVFPIVLPPLRERPEDIPALARHFAIRAATRFRLPAVLPTDEDIARLRAYAWPGNIREMASVVDRAAILGNGERLEIAKALGSMADGALKPDATSPRPVPPAASATPTSLSLDAAMKAHIERALRQAAGRVEGPFGIARQLAINPNTLRARMRKLGIRPRDFRESVAPA
jgi:transcriptional regulator with GAF, ATPase, and Fis domain